MGDLDPQIRGARPADIRELSATFTRAFERDPAFTWVLPDVSRRARALSRYFRALLTYDGIDHGVTDVACLDGMIVGGSVWFRPGEWPPPLSRQLRTLPAYLLAFGARLGVASSWVKEALRVHPKTAHWYLACIGVDPLVQSRGVGAALLRARLHSLDEAGMSSYLEASSPASVKVYAHLGFVASEPLRLPPGAPPITPMLRHPVKPSKAPST